MGWERKRGKLAEFNRFVLDRRARARSRSSWATRRRSASVRYVITLDADTVLPPDAAPLLVGALAHPLNRAVYDPALGRVVRGLRHPAAARRRLAAERAPLALRRDPLRAPGRRSVHHRRLRRVPGPLRRGQLHRQGHLRRRRVRARDARPLPREHPAVARPDRGELRARRPRHRHRSSTTTTRPATSPSPAASTAGSAATGSCCRWLTATGCPGPDGPEPNRLSLLSRWKILDNLRRSTVEIAQLAFLVAGWTVLPGAAAPLDPARASARSPRRGSSSLLLAVLRPPLDKSWRAYYARGGPRRGHQRAAGRRWPSSFLPHQAWVSADAIVRTLWRLCGVAAGTCSSGRPRRRPSAA